MAQRVGPAPGWTGYGARVVLVGIAQPETRIAPTLPPQQRGDAACLTLVMAQTLGGTPAPAGAYRAVAGEDEGPIFALSA